MGEKKGCGMIPLAVFNTESVIVVVLVTKSGPTLCDVLDYRPPGSSVHGIFQARVLEWAAIAFSGCTLHIS